MMDIHLLVVEDDAEDRMLVERALAKASFKGKVHFAHNGEEAIKYLRGRAQQGVIPATARPNLVILDLNMPKLNGWETLEILKANPEWASVPVIIFTTSTAEEDIRASYKCGASCFITKPDSYKGYIDIFNAFIQFWSKTAQVSH